jgi:hypothetical protein
MIHLFRFWMAVEAPWKQLSCADCGMACVHVYVTSRPADPHAVPKEMGIFHEISRCAAQTATRPSPHHHLSWPVCVCLPVCVISSSDCDLSVRNIIHRIRENQEQLSSKFVKKIKVRGEVHLIRSRARDHIQPEAAYVISPGAACCDVWVWCVCAGGAAVL